jgi:putative ABC transport system permease protein
MPELTDYRTNCWVKAKEGADLNEVKEKIINGNINGVNSAVTIYDNNARVDSYMTSVGSMTNAIKIFAIILAVIVLINLTILNFRERSREIATLKVLGYSTVEIAWSLIYETMILAIIGTLLGLVLAYPLELIVLGTNVTPLVSWKYIIFFKSYLIGFGISAGVALFINIIMTSSIKRISMSESLKSVE